MNVLQFSTNIPGGASRAAIRLHRKLLARGINALLGVATGRDTDEPGMLNVIKAMPLPAKLRFAVAGAAEHIIATQYRQRSPGVLSFNLLRRFNERRRGLFPAPDIVGLYWVGDFLTPDQLKSFNVPVFWRLSDLWPFTGGCHYPGACLEYTRSCGSCPMINSSRAHDITRRVWKNKARAWRTIDLTVVAPSKWIASCARKSSLFRERRIEHIPTGIDQTLFKPIDRQTARHILGIPQEERLILFGAMHATGDARKGSQYLRSALEVLKGSVPNARLAIYGSLPDSHSLDFCLPTHWLGPLQDDVSLALAYSASDVFVSPSVEDNLPNTVLESLACGTPVVAFNIGGLPDCVTTGTNGYLAIPGNAEDLAAGIRFVLEDNERRATLSRNSRTTIETGFTLDHQADSYIRLFESLIETSRQRKKPEAS